uniref:Metalloendopeptidase n=2 Tax=Graphocephala atropunctata TaxID=36148 RepID=A0A1B6KRF0_9HEMI
MRLLILVLSLFGHKAQAFFDLNGKFWPNGVITYDVSPELPQHMIKSIKYSIEYINSLSCVRWVQRNPWEVTVVNYVSFQYWYGEGGLASCRAVTEMAGGQQQVELGPLCMGEGTDNEKHVSVIHEMFHTMGFYHEHQRLVRDCYVELLPPTIIFSNPAYQIRFHLYSNWPYDYESVMHYETSNIKAWDRNQKLGRRDGKVSKYDIERLKYVYCREVSFCTREENEKLCDEIEEQEKKNRHCKHI